MVPVVSSEQLRVDEKTVALAEKLFSEAADFNASKDVYGWSSWLFFPWRGEDGGFFTSLVHLVCLLVNESHVFPSVCAVMLASGALTPLHKVSKEEQISLEESGLEPKIRPINSGCLLAKAVLSTVLENSQRATGCRAC